MELDKVLSGKVFVRVSDDLVCVHPPNAELRYLADFLSQEVYDQAVSSGAFTVEELEIFLRGEGLWTKDDEELLKQITQDIHACKVEYFNSFHFKKKLIKLKGQIRDLERQHLRVSNKRLYLAEYTADSAQLLWKDAYLLERTAKLAGGLSATQKYGVDRVAIAMKNSRMYDSDIRRIAKTGEWKAYWIVMKAGVSPFMNTDLTSEQLALITWAKTYDSVAESPECPSDDVIQDDIALDGWFLVQVQNSKRENQPDSKASQASEVFVTTNFRSNGEVDASDIHNMNSSQGKKAMNRKMSELKQRGSMKELDYSGSRAEMQMYANRQGFNR